LWKQRKKITEKSVLKLVQSLSSTLYEKGYHNILNIDFSQIVIEKMSVKYAGMQQMAWKVPIWVPHYQVA